MKTIGAAVVAVMILAGVGYEQTRHGITSISVERTVQIHIGGQAERTLNAPCGRGTFHRFPADDGSTFPWWVRVCTRR